MGLFSKKKKVTVGVTAVRMADKISDPYQQAVLSSVLGNKKITESFKAESLKGFYNKTELFYRFGKNYYVHGLPEGYRTYTDINRAKIATVLGRIFALPVIVQNAFCSFADYIYFGHVDLQTHFLYNPSTKLIGKPPITYPLGTKVKVLNITMEDGNYSLDVEITKVPLNPNDPVPPKEYTTYSRTFVYDKSKIYLHTVYQLPSDVAESTFRYWYYDVLTETYPEIDTILNESWDSPFYPLVPIRENKVNVINTDNKYNIEKMLKKIGVELDSVTEAIMSRNFGNEPDLIDECFIGFFANLHSQEEATRIYLWEFFLELYNKQKVTKAKFDSWNNDRQGVDTPQESITIKEKDFNIRLLWNYIDAKAMEGKIGKVGTVTLGWEVKPRNVLSGADFEESALILTKQDTPNTVIEMVIHGLEHLVDVYEGSMHSTTLADLNDEDRKYGFFIPLSRHIVKKVPFVKRSQLMMDCLTMVLYAVQITYVKWYQRGFFKLLITVVMLVVSFYFGDWSGTFAQGFWAAATAIASNIIINMILVKGLEVVVGMIGGELAAIIAAAVAIYALSTPNASLFGLSDPKALLQASTLTIEASNNVTADEFRKVLQNTDDLLKSIKEKKEEIKKAYDMLDNEYTIDFFDTRKGGFYFNPDETPNQFFTRTVYEKNPGTMVYDELEYYYENALKLSVRPNWEF